MQTIGFTNKYYTLWEVSDEYEVRVSEYEYYEKRDYHYVKNLSMDLDKAKAKLEGDYNIDLGLRGESDFTHSSEKLNDAPENVFAFGKYCGKDIIETNDVSYTEWYYNQTQNQVAKKLLVDNCYVEHEGSLISSERYDYIVGKAEKEALLASLDTGHHFGDGNRIEVKIKEVHCFNFETCYGYTYISLYATEDGKLLKYMGSNPPEISCDKFDNVKATIKHDNYNGVDETKLQRISIVPDKAVAKAKAKAKRLLKAETKKLLAQVSEVEFEVSDYYSSVEDFDNETFIDYVDFEFIINLGKVLQLDIDNISNDLISKYIVMLNPSYKILSDKILSRMWMGWKYGSHIRTWLDEVYNKHTFYEMEESVLEKYT